MTVSRQNMPLQPTLNRLWVSFILGIALAFKIYACFQVPVVTSDALRHLGYSSHALDNNFTIYNTIAADFAPESWTRYWSEKPYIYPPATLMFFYLFSVFHLGIFWVKIVLTSVEVGCAYLFYKRVSKIAALLFFCAPVSFWYTAHEGQFEVLQTLFIILNVISVRKHQWRLAGFWFSLSVQIKQYGVLLFPWILYQIWRNRNQEHASLIKIGNFSFQGLVLGFIPFLPFYIQSPGLLFLPITSMANTTYNPFAWNILQRRLFGWNPYWLISWNACFTYAPLVILIVFGIIAWRKKSFATMVSTVPLASFWLINKSLKWGQFWYSMIAPGFIFCISRKFLIHLLLMLHLMQGLHSAVAIFVKPIGWIEPPSSQSLMQSCMFRCEPQQQSSK